MSRFTTEKNVTLFLLLISGSVEIDLLCAWFVPNIPHINIKKKDIIISRLEANFYCRLCRCKFSGCTDYITPNKMHVVLGIIYKISDVRVANICTPALIFPQYSRLHILIQYLCGGHKVAKT